MGDIASGAGITNTAPIVNTPVASTDAILGDIGNSSAVAMGKQDKKGEHLLAMPLLKLARTLWPKFFPNFPKVSIRELSPNSGPSVPVKRFEQWAAWTQRSNEVWLRVEVVPDDAQRVAFVCAVLSHEKVHVEQFTNGNGERPKTLEEMIRFEVDAYQSGASWLHHKCEAALDALFSVEVKKNIFSEVMSFYQQIWNSFDEFQDILAQIDKDKIAGVTAEEIYKRVRQSMIDTHNLPEYDKDLPKTLKEPDLLMALYNY